MATPLVMLRNPDYETSSIFMMRILLIFIVIFGCVLVYGYHHSITHGTLYAQIDIQGDSGSGPTSLSGTEVIFQDAEGNLLATGRGDQNYNFIHLIHPEIGDCRDAEQAALSSSDTRTAWQRCFERISTWIPSWVRKVHQVELKTENCQAIIAPVMVSEHSSDWFFWWVPHPHIGGKPYTYFTLHIKVNENYCEKSP